ncbi:hypothetical protein VDP44_16655 [Xanthomonas campestris pv. campestris]|uniref:hypothetical protein n=1 Tax=Xanthomonas arboricola TaxID=56448 RepID=UPI000A62B159|nr:hypothetical protein [Xanthomonas arboricola]MEB1100766.1 hypothetical protein [Xanthomonas campestris pv. campestris]MEB1940269.1 hypothetical protein [Xanthomonas campestris pv. campestris]MEB2060021.1 hypothetical protein [Xanthomonas campestris pv. campestris]
MNSDPFSADMPDAPGSDPWSGSGRRQVTDRQLESYARLTSASDATLRAYKEIADCLGDTTPYHASMSAENSFLEPGGELFPAPLITGIGIGLPDPHRLGASIPGAGHLHLYTSEPISAAAAIDNVRGTLNVQAFNAKKIIPVTAIHTGIIDALHRKHWSPVVAGVSIGHPSVSAGTLGAFATGLQAPRDEYLLVLSNNHVLAAVNAARIGDAILQPGVADGGVVANHKLGLLENYIPIDFSGDNLVDAATAWIGPTNDRREALYYRGSKPAFFGFGVQPKAASVGLRVGKSGRTSGLTAGYVSALGVRIRVDMGLGRSAWFVDQIAIRGQEGNFSSGGDSGSLVWSWDSERAPVGLLFAGGGGTTFANPIDPVLNSLDIRLTTE